MNYTYMKGCALCMTLCLTSAALPGRSNAESSAIVNEVLQSSVVKGVDRKSTRLNSSHMPKSRMPSSA